MNKAELAELLANGENSGVEFKRDDLEPEKLARELAAFANLRGGRLLLGVEDNGQIDGITRTNLEEWVMNIARDKIFPPLIPYFEIIHDAEPGKSVAVVEVGPSPTKPCRVLHNQRKAAYIRVGTAVREPSDDELAQMLQSSQRLNFGKTPLVGTALIDLYQDRLKYYLTHRLGYQEAASDDEWVRSLVNLELLDFWHGQPVATINGMLLFGKDPKKVLPQAGIRAVAYRGIAESYDVIDDVIMPDPLIPALDPNGRMVDGGLIERALGFVAKHCPPRNPLEGARNIHNSEFPEPLIRELIVNAVAHRDYTIAGTDIMLAIFSDRVELTSPGRLPNGATVDALRTGFRYHRNQTLANVLRDYRYIDARGMGIRLKIIPLTRELTGRDPEFRASDFNFTVILPRPQ